MSNTIEDHFKRVVVQVFNNWTALQLAVENDMGGPTSHQTAIEVINWICEYCIAQNNLQVSDLTETLEDILDEEFSTICEDDSPKEIAYLLVKFLTYLKEENLQQFEADFNSLPICNIWLSRGAESNQKNPQQVNNQSDSNTPLPEQQMDLDPEWTVVHKRKK